MKKVLLIGLLFLAAFGVANLAVSMITVLVLGVDAAMLSPKATFGIYVGSFVTTIGLMSIFRKSLGVHLPSLRPEVGKLNLPLIVLGLIAILAVGVVLEPLLELMPNSNMDALYDMMSGGVWAIFTGVIAAPILEEYLFRGVLQRSFFNATSSSLLSVIVSAAIFGLIHIIPQQMVNAFFAGLVLGVIYHLTHSLTTVVIVHMLNNGIAYLQFLYFGPQDSVLSLIFSSPLAYAILYTSSLLLCIVLGIWAFKKLARRHTAGKRPLYGAK